MHQTRGRPCGNLAPFIDHSNDLLTQSLPPLEGTKHREQVLRGIAHCIEDADLRIDLHMLTLPGIS